MVAAPVKGHSSSARTFLTIEQHRRHLHSCRSLVAAAAVCALQKETLREHLQDSQQKLETASSQLQTLSRALGGTTAAQLNTAFQERLSQLTDTSEELQSTAERLAQAQAAQAEVSCSA